MPFDPEAGICVRAGFFALRSIADYYGIPYDPDPQPGDAISITKEEFLDACDELVAAGIPVRADREAAWLDFTGWRVNYDVPLLGAGRVRDGAVRAVVVGPVVPRTAAARASRPAPRRRPSSYEGRGSSRIQVSCSAGVSSRRMNHSVPNTIANASGGSARKKESSAICDGCAAIAARLRSSAPVTSTVVVIARLGDAEVELLGVGAPPCPSGTWSPMRSWSPRKCSRLTVAA